MQQSHQSGRGCENRRAPKYNIRTSLHVYIVEHK